MRLLAVLVLGLCATASHAAPPELAGCHIFKVWDFQKDVEGWKRDHNVDVLSVKDGALQVRNNGTDPWIVLNDPGGPDTRSYSFVGIRMRSSAAGFNQVYFGTDLSPGAGEGKVANRNVFGDNKWHFYELDMSRLPLWNGKVTLLRIDPANGSEEVGAKVDIDWIAIYQRPARVEFGRPYAGTDDKGLFVSIPFTNTGGEPSGDIDILANDARQRIAPLKPHEQKTATLRVRKLIDGEIRAHATVGRNAAFSACLIPPAAGKPLKSICDGKSSLSFIGGKVITEARLSSVGKTPVSGVFRPLATLVYRDKHGILRWIEAGADSLTVNGDTARLAYSRASRDGRIGINWTFKLPRGANEGVMTCELTSSAPLDILRFEGPRLLAGEGTFGAGKTHGLFPGLEYLDKDEPSGAVKHIGPKFADRHVPHPYKVTVPVMAIKSPAGVIGMSWDPLAEWARGERLPCAEFESPNKSQGAKNHLLTLFAPSIPKYVDENTELARTPYSLRPGETLKLSAGFFARSGEKITDVIPAYYATHGLPKPPPVAHGVGGTIDVCMKAYTESLFFGDRKWKNHFGLHQTPAFDPRCAAIVLAESLRRGNPAIARKTGLDPSDQLTKYTGTTLDWFSDAAEKAADGRIAAQSPDGGYAYAISTELAEKVKSLSVSAGMDVSDLGEIGSTNSGIITSNSIGLIDYALRTAQPKYVTAVLKTVDKLNTFTVPRGAQTWEVHAHAPDVLAAGQAVYANVAAYKMTGKSGYLDFARSWAYTGLPFIYSWIPPVDPVPASVWHFDEHGEGNKGVLDPPSEFYQDPRRPINPGASIAVFGTTMYVGPWFGKPVQWCGLAWAEDVREYLKLRPDPTLSAVADAVFASCTQQQFDKGWAAGTYPDSWDLMLNQVNQAFIHWDHILRYALDLKGEKMPTDVDSRGFDLGGKRHVLSTYALIESLDTDRDTVSAALKSYAGQDSYVCIAPVDKPAVVSVNGGQPAESADLRSSPEGYYYDPAHSALHIKWRPVSRSSYLRMIWR